MHIEPELLELYNYPSRSQKAHKIERILLDYLGTNRDVSKLRCLDVGCSIGVISDNLARTFAQVIGVEPLAESVGIARQLHSDSRATFLNSDGLRLPFQDESFDIIVCAQVYEHSTYPHRLVAEIRRVLKRGGCCFFSGPNKWWPIEYHYDWYFLHWLPQGLLHRYCQHRYGHPFDLVLYNYWQLRTLWRDFERHDYTLRLVYEPEKFWDCPDRYRWAHIVPRPIASAIKFLLPNFNWILSKPYAPTNA